MFQTTRDNMDMNHLWKMWTGRKPASLPAQVVPQAPPWSDRNPRRWIKFRASEPHRESVPLADRTEFLAMSPLVTFSDERSRRVMVKLTISNPGTIQCKWVFPFNKNDIVSV